MQTPDSYDVKDGDGQYPGFKRVMQIGPGGCKIGFDATDDYTQPYLNPDAALHFSNNSTMYGFLAPDGTKPSSGHRDYLGGMPLAYQGGIDTGTGHAAFLCDTNDGKVFIGGRQMVASASNGHGFHIGTTGSDTGPLVFGTDNISRAAFDSTGNFAIGTIKPTKYFEIYATGSESQVFILSGSGAGSSPDESSYTDVNFFVSGTAGSRGSNTKGTSLFGGDVVISGTLYDGSGNTIGGGGVSFVGGAGSNNQMITADGAGDIVAESNVTFNGSS